jgi:hypothetical protein
MQEEKRSRLTRTAETPDLPRSSNKFTVTRGSFGPRLSCELLFFEHPRAPKLEVRIYLLSTPLLPEVGRLQMIYGTSSPHSLIQRYG